MKLFLYSVTIALFLSCSNNKTSTQSEPENAPSETKAVEQWLEFDGKDNMPHVVLVSGDEEYRSEEALPQLAKILSTHHGFNCTVLFAQDPEVPGQVNANYLRNIPGMEKLASADLMVIFTRFRALPDDQMQHIDNYLKSGKPVIGLRTATHGFNFEKDESTSQWVHYSNGYKGEKEAWQGGFGRLVLGEKWVAHHGHHKHQSTKGLVAKNAKEHSITNGIEDGDVWGASDVYEVRLPLPGDSEPIILGQVINRKGEYNEGDIFFGMSPEDDEIATENNKEKTVNDILMPVAWTKSYQIPGGKQGKAFTSTVGAANDLLIEGTRRLLINSVFWAVDLPVPEKANVDIIPPYEPTKFEFRKADYWPKRKMTISALK
ncbi:MAG: ThuA domain-containing protein [Cyclobacteriaceae bacterium]